MARIIWKRVNWSCRAKACFAQNDVTDGTEICVSFLTMGVTFTRFPPLVAKRRIGVILINTMRRITLKTGPIGLANGGFAALVKIMR